MDFIKKILLLNCFLISIICHAQESEIDSLKNVLKELKDDSVKVNTLNALSKQYFDSSAPLAIQYATEAKALAGKIDFKKGVATALKNIGIVYYLQGTYIEAINYWQQALSIFNATNDKEGKASILANLGAIYFDQGEDSKANEYYFSSMKTAEEIDDTNRIATALNNIGAVYQHKDKTQDKALEYYQRALPLDERLYSSHDPILKGYGKKLLGTTNVGIGEIYLKRFEKDSSLANLDTAIFYFDKSLKVYKGTVDEPYTLNQMGKLYVKKKEFDKAIQYQKNAFEIAKKLESKNDIAISLTGLAQSYEQKGDAKMALKTFKEAEEYASQTDAVYSLKDIYDGLAKSYAKMHDYINGYKYQFLLIGTKDSIYNIEGDKKLQGIVFGFEMEKKKGQIDLLTKDKQIQQQEIRRQKIVRNSFVGGFAVVLLFAGIFFSQRNRISKEKKRSDELLLNILPSETAEELKATGTAKTKSFDTVSVMFTDFKNFTQASEKLTPEELVSEINHCYSEFDKIITRYGIEKIKTIGDSYMCAGGLPVTNTTHPVDVVKAGLEMQQFITNNKAERIANGQPFFDLRLGIHTGPVVAGIVGIKKFAYDIWGDTVNTASRMESSGEIGKVNISGATFELIKDQFKCIHRGKVEAKNKGQIDMYFVESFNEVISSQ